MAYVDLLLGMGLDLFMMFVVFFLADPFKLVTLRFLTLEVVPYLLKHVLNIAKLLKHILYFFDLVRLVLVAMLLSQQGGFSKCSSPCWSASCCCRTF